jgi:hypothetical protein
MANFILLNDPGSQRQRLIRQDHISGIEVEKADHSITLLLLGGQAVHLTHEESKQFLQHAKTLLPPAGSS